MRQILAGQQLGEINGGQSAEPAREVALLLVVPGAGVEVRQGEDITGCAVLLAEPDLAGVQKSARGIAEKSGVMCGEEKLGAGGVELRALEHGDERCDEQRVKAGVELIDDEQIAPAESGDCGGGRCEPGDGASALRAQAQLESVAVLAVLPGVGESEGAHDCGDGVLGDLRGNIIGVRGEEGAQSLDPVAPARWMLP